VKDWACYCAWNHCWNVVKGSPYSITKHRVPELIPVLRSQPVGDVSHKPGSRLPLLSARHTVTITTLKRAATNFCCLANRGTMGVKNLPKTVTRQHRGCDLNPGLTAPESSTLTNLATEPHKHVVITYSHYYWCCVWCSLYGHLHLARNIFVANVTVWWSAKLKLDELCVLVNTGMWTVLLLWKQLCL